MRKWLLFFIVFFLLYLYLWEVTFTGDSIVYNRSKEASLIQISMEGGNKALFELYGSGDIYIKRDIYSDKAERGRISQRKIEKLLNYLINIMHAGELDDCYPEEYIRDIAMYPNPELRLDITTQGFKKSITFAYSNVCKELEIFRAQGQLDEDRYRKLRKLRDIFNYLMNYKL